MIHEASCPDLRALGVKEGCNGPSGLLPYVLKELQSALMLLMISMGEIESGHIHVSGKLKEGLLIVEVGTKSTDYLCVSHTFSSIQK